MADYNDKISKSQKLFCLCEKRQLFHFLKILDGYQSNEKFKKKKNSLKYESIFFPFNFIIY